MSGTVPKDVQDDIKFLMSFAPAESPEEVSDGLPAMYYLTGTHKGDVELAERVKSIKAKYKI